jgi:predicted short-subunit dehydrogenase-like oxidoreductase (DUF2520 family)
MSEKITIVGAGRMGLALGAAFRNSGIIDRLTYIGRSMEAPPHPMFDGVDAADYLVAPHPIPAGTSVVLLAVPDGKLSEVAYDVANSGPVPPGCVALHLAGAISTEVLEPLHARGYAVGSMHPLQAIADPWHSGDRLVGVGFGLAGEPAAIAVAKRLVAALEGLPLIIPPAKRQIYHASAVVASNYLISLLSFSVRLMMETGVSESDAVSSLLPLVHGTLENLEHLGLAASLTGPIPRGDADTIRLHLARLSGSDRALYCELGLELLRLSRSVGLDAEKASEIEALLSTY